MAHKQRGAAAYAIIFLMLLGLGGSHLLIKDQASYFKRAKKEREAKSDEAAREARQALINYMLLRAENDLAIAQGGSGSIKPRLLMLPCPDNVGDKNLDGSQDPGCRSAGTNTNVVKNILDGGSRFGRLPWRSRNINSVSHSINDGIGADARDAAGNRLWYALSRNMAPAADDKNLPLNFHRLMTHEDEWLTVINERGEKVREKIAAVILAPDQARQPRYPESVLETLVIDYSRDVAAADGLLAPARYFESYRAPALTVTNYTRDGVFIRARRSQEQGFNDALAYISIDGLINDEGFIGSYARLVGAGDTHNLPGKNRPLANAAAALAAHYALLGFYPPPARRDAPAHVSERERHCMVTHSGGDAHVITLTAGIRLSSAHPVTMRSAGAPPDVMTMTLAQPAAFLLRQHAAAAAAATVILEDIAQPVTALTLARYARITLAAGAPLLVTAAQLQTLALTMFRLAAGARAMLAAAAVITLAPQTPLRPPGDLLGWFADHTLPGRRADNDGQKFILPAAARAMIWADARLTTALLTAALQIGDVLTLTAGSALQLEKDFAQLDEMDAEIHYADGRAVTLRNALPTPQTYERRQLAVWLLSDAARAAHTVIAPALLFPWRKEAGSGADSRDSLHPYPPCLDTRNFFTRRFQTAIEDQTIVYAVAEECHYGGDPAACGRRGGLTVSLAAGAWAALPQALTLTHSYQARVGNVLALTLQNGIVQNAADVTLRQKIILPVLDGGGATLAAFRLPAGYRFISGAPVRLPARTPVTGGGGAGAVFENVPALLIYSPAPLPRAACALGANSPPVSGALTSPPVTLVNQQAEAADITNLCYWLDDEENADGDDFYVIYPPPARRGGRQRNDFFILPGGRLRIG